MTPRAVLDASAAVHVICGLEAAAEILPLLEDTGLVMAPDLYSAEVANALWKYVAHGAMSPSEAGELLADSLQLVDTLVASRELAGEALIAAASLGQPVYVMLYAVLARRHGAVVVTMDRRLRSTLARMDLQAFPEA